MTNISVRQATDQDRNCFLKLVCKLSQYNRKNHGDECKYDDYQQVLTAIAKKAEHTFDHRGENELILIAEMDSQPVGYALGRIYSEDETADNGTGLMGLFDELFVDEVARGQGLGKLLIDETIAWMKQQGVRRVKLHAYSWNESAKKTYENIGFEEYVVSYNKFL